ncbi:fimbrial protein [Escherichia coli]
MKYNNVIFLGLCLGLTTYSALSADSVIKISGRVLDYGCTVSSDSLNFTVDLQKNSARQFPTTGSTSPAVPFQITLSECSKGTTGVRVAFNGIEDAENNTLLKLDEGSNTASGLGIEILDGNMRPVKLNDLHAGMSDPTGTRTEQYFALLRSSEVNSEVRQSGRASATFTLYFNNQSQI